MVLDEIGLDKNMDSSMHCNSFVLDSISIQNPFEIDYFPKKKHTQSL